MGVAPRCMLTMSPLGVKSSTSSLNRSVFSESMNSWLSRVSPCQSRICLSQ